MKNQVKTFSQYINESRTDSDHDIAEWEPTGSHSIFGRLHYGKKTINVPYPEKDPNFKKEFSDYMENGKTYAKWVCKVAAKHGIERVYDRENDKILKCSTYIKESDEFGTRMNSGARSSGPNAGNGIAVWEVYDYNSEVKFAGESITLDDDDSSYDEEGNFVGMEGVFEAAAELGASSDMVWSVEDNKILFKDTAGKSNGKNIAKVYLSTSMSGEFATIEFQGEEISVDEEESLRKTWQKILDMAMKMGASGIYSVEDEEMITQADINKLDDSPSGWE